MVLDLNLFKSIETITSLAELPDLERIWKQYDAVCGGGALRHQPRSANPGTINVLSKAAANCLHLLLDQQGPAGTDTRSWTMPTQPETVTAVRMTVHIFAYFTDWMSTVSPANNTAQIQQARTCVEQAVQEAGGLAQVVWLSAICC